MKNRTKVILGIALLVIGGGLIAWNLTGPQRGNPDEDDTEKEVTMNDLSPAVQATIQRESAGGTIGEIERNEKKGQVDYEVEIVKNGTEIEVKIAEDGTVIQRESKAAKPQG